MIWRNTVGKKSVLHRMGSSLISEEVKFEQYTLHLFNTHSTDPSIPCSVKGTLTTSQAFLNSAVQKIFLQWEKLSIVSAQDHYAASKHMWPLSTRNAITETKELFLFA